MKLQRPIVIPLALLVYLAVMAWIGYPAYRAGATSALSYFGGIGATLAIIVVLHFTLKKRERLRRERLADLDRQTNQNTTD